MGISALQSQHRVAELKKLPWKWAGRLGACVAGVAAVAFVWRLGLAHFGREAAWCFVQIPLGVCTVVLAWRFASRHTRLWVHPAKQLVELIERVRAGEEPIQSLSEVRGPIAPLAQCVQEVLRELRREEQAHTRLRGEINQLVRNRTEKLESKIQAWRTRAFRDPLTGLCNRRDLDEQLPKVIDQCRADGTSLSVLSIDLDNFKKVNDTLGHAAGDKLLRDVGNLIGSAIRDDIGLAFRIGGDEFVILLPNHDATASAQIGVRLSALVDQLAKTVRSEPKPGLSIGVINFEDLRNVSPEELLRKADEAMYEKKAARKSAR